MKQLLCVCLTLLLTGFLVACKNKRPLSDITEDNQTPENTFNWQGTYEGILPAADCPGIYVLLAIDSTHYENLYKYIERPGIFVSKGEIKWNDHGDSITLIGDHTTYGVAGGILYKGKFQLSKISDDYKLPRLLITQTMKDNKTGVNAVLETYTVGSHDLANLYFKDKTYKLKMDDKEKKVREYTDGKARLILDSISSIQDWEIHPVFIDGKDTCDFTILSPVNEIYIEKGTPKLTQSLDVIYLNGESGNEVKLLSPDYKLCFTLPQIEASAKTAKYYSNGIMWSSGLNHATLTLGDEHYDFIEKPIVKKDTIKSASHATSKTKQKITSH